MGFSTVTLARVAAFTAFVIASLFSANVNAQTLEKDSSIDIRVAPESPIIEIGNKGQNLHFDFIIKNNGAVSAEVEEISVRVYNTEGVALSRLVLNHNGVSPGIETIPRRTIEPGKSIVVFNPFYIFHKTMDLHRLDYEFLLGDDSIGERKRISVRPRFKRNISDLRIPVSGRLLVWSGSDYYSHHRRLDYHHPLIEKLGITRNSSRYALDIVMVDAAGDIRRHIEPGSADHFIYGKYAVAPAAGIIVAARNDLEEGEPPIEAATKDPMLLFGNYVVISHGNGEFSQMGHFITGSVRVRAGDRVSAGQVIAKIGNTGASLFPHLHYQLVSGADINSEGIPAYFCCFERVGGQGLVGDEGEAVDTGDIIVAN